MGKLCCLFKKYNADYDLSAKEGADTLAFISLLEEKLMPALVRFTWGVQKLVCRDTWSSPFSDINDKKGGLVFPQSWKGANII